MSQIRSSSGNWFEGALTVLLVLALAVFVGYIAYLLVYPQSALALFAPPDWLTSSLTFLSLDDISAGRGNPAASQFGGEGGKYLGGWADSPSNSGADPGSPQEGEMPGYYDETDLESDPTETVSTAAPTSSEPTEEITPTEADSGTQTPTLSETPLGPTKTTTPTGSPTEAPIPTDTPMPTSQPTSSPSSWHSPDTHEHGDAPPQWVLSSGLQPDFNAGERHEGYKAMLITESNARGWVGRQKAIYFVFHAFSFPPAMRVQFHSYQLWVLHSDNTVSWLQGAVDTGTYPEHRVDKCTENRNKPDMRIPYLSSGCISDETWYPFGRGIHPDLVRAMSGGYYFDPTDDLRDPSTWDETGMRGLTRLDTVIVRPGNDGLKEGHFCAHRNSGEIGSCGGSFLPQYVSPTMFEDCAENYSACEVRGEAQKRYKAPNVKLPN